MEAQRGYKHSLKELEEFIAIAPKATIDQQVEERLNDLSRQVAGVRLVTDNLATAIAKQDAFITIEEKCQINRIEHLERELKALSYAPAYLTSLEKCVYGGS
ncbi:MAG TPA: hypothetical protein DDW76_16015 [Cyanobacteria bacterium UBA11369]|nr:hypothetical protein [Cyanobacteria bacterium UBA11369]